MDLFITDETPNIELIITDENQEVVLQITDEEPPLQIFIDDHHGLSAYQLYLLVTTDNPPMTLEEWLESLAGGDLSGKANIDASNIDPHIAAWRAKLITEPEDPTEEETANAPKARTEDGWRTIANATPAFISLGNNPAGSFHLTGTGDVQGFVTKLGKFLWSGREFVIKTDQAVTLKASTFTDTSNAKHWTFAEDYALKADSWAIIKEKGGELLVIEMGVDVDASITDLYIHQVTIVATSSITTDTLGAIVSGGTANLLQHGRNVKISNGVNAITISCETTSAAAFVASYTKLGSATITFTAGSGATLVQVDGTSVLNGIAGSTACLTRSGNTFYLQISNR